MKFFRFYLLICIVFLSFNNVVLAQSSGEDFEGQAQDITTNQKTSFYYLLGNIGYNGFISEGVSASGLDISILGGLQQSRFFAMDLAVGYSNLGSSRINLKYALLFQTNIKLTPSWSILPKVGLGASGSYLIIDENTSLFDAGLYGTLGVRATYKNIIVGLSYEHTMVSRFPLNDFRILAEAGIRF